MSEKEKTLNPDPTVKSEKKQEKKETPKPEVVQQPNVLVSNMDAHIYDRMKSQPKTLEEIEAKVLEKTREGRHQLSLPPEIEAYENRFRFRWLMKKKRSLDHALDVKGWELVNRSYFPDVPDHYFNVSGAMERGDAILAFMSKRKAEELQKEAGKQSRERIEAQFNRHKGDPRYYSPKENSEQVVMI